MSIPLQTQPTGLVQALNLQSVGRAPDQLEESVRATVDARDNYGARQLGVLTNVAGGVTAGQAVDIVVQRNIRLRAFGMQVANNEAAVSATGQWWLSIIPPGNVFTPVPIAGGDLGPFGLQATLVMNRGVEFDIVLPPQTILRSVIVLNASIDNIQTTFALAELY